MRAEIIIIQYRVQVHVLNQAGFGNLVINRRRFIWACQKLGSLF